MVSGKEIMTLHLLKGLKEKGHDCLCITSAWGSPEFRRRLTILGIPFVPLRIGFISKTLTFPAMWMSIDQLIRIPVLYIKFNLLMRKHKPDVIIHTNFHHLFLLIPILTSGKNIYWSHEFVPYSSFYIRLFTLFLKKISLFIGVSVAVTDSIRKIVGDAKVKTIRNGIPMPSFVSNHVDWRDHIFSLAIIGQLSKHKGHEVLFRSVAILASKNKSFRLNIIGEGKDTYLSSLKDLAVNLKIEKYLIWRGFLNSPQEIYSGIDAVVVPSVEPDPFPTIVMESNARGIPVVVSRIGGLPEMIEEGRNGYMFEPGGDKALAKIVEMMMLSDTFQELRHSSRQFAQSNFELSRFLNQFDEALKWKS